MRKKTIISIILLGAVTLGAYEGYGIYMRNKLSKAYAGLVISNILQTDANATRETDRGHSAYSHLGSANAFDYAGTYIPQELKNDFIKCKKIQEDKPTNKALLEYNEELLLNRCKELCDRFNVDNVKVNNMFDKFKSFKAI